MKESFDDFWKASGFNAARTPEQLRFVAEQAWKAGREASDLSGAKNLSGTEVSPHQMARLEEGGIVPSLAGNWNKAEWDSASNVVFAQRRAYPPDSLSAIYRDIAINLQAELHRRGEGK